jgi:hypothetical protein
LKSGQISTFAGIPFGCGSKNGPKEQALFENLSNVIFTKNGKFIIFCDNNMIKFMKIK